MAVTGANESGSQAESPELDASDIDEQEWLRSMTSNPTFDFLKDPQEDIYSPDDGRPFQSSCR